MTELTWVAPPAALALLPGEIHLWRASLAPGEALVQRLAQTLSEDERARADRFRFEHDRRAFITGRGLLRAQLGRYLGTAADRVAFEYGPCGKPRLTSALDGGRLRFNLSHAAGLLLCAFALDREIGIDVERIAPAPEKLRIAALVFSDAETAALRALPEDEQTQAFFECWTSREAWLKTRGDGLTAAVRRGDEESRPGDPCSVRVFAPAPGYIAALTIAGPDGGVMAWEEPMM